jgi:hypothetical protein
MAHLSRGDTPVSLTRSSQNQKGHTIQKLDTCSKSAQSPMNSGGRASVEKILPKRAGFKWTGTKCGAIFDDSASLSP